MTVTLKVYQFGAPFFFFNLEKYINNIHFDHSAKKDHFEKFILKKSKKLRKSKIPNVFEIEEILQNVPVQTFEDLISIDRLIESQEYESQPVSNMLHILNCLKEIRNEFFAKPVYTLSTKKECIHPMDIIHRALEKSKPESARILTENLDKMRYALPLVISSYTSKPKLKLWPLMGINRQTKDRKFNMFNHKHSHHVVAFVRLGFSDGLHNKLSSHSKSELANKIFFEDQPKFLSRRHPKLSKCFKRNVPGCLETAIHTPNDTFDTFFQVWNLYGNIMYAGLKSQIELIAKAATAIIVVLDDDQALDEMEKMIIQMFGSQRILVLIPAAASQTDSESDSDEETVSNRMTTLKCISYDSTHEQDSLNTIRTFVQNELRSGRSFISVRLLLCTTKKVVKNRLLVARISSWD